MGMRFRSNRRNCTGSGFASGSCSLSKRRCRNAIRPQLGPPWQGAGIRAGEFDDEIQLQSELHKSAMEVLSEAEEALVEIARQSQRVRVLVSCDQEDWPGIIVDCLHDLSGDTFGCLPDAIDRATRKRIYDL